MNIQFITKCAKFCLYAVIVVMFVNIISNFMQINLFDQYFEKGLYSYDTFLVLAEKNDVRVSIVGIVFIITIFSSVFII